MIKLFNIIKNIFIANNKKKQWLNNIAYTTTFITKKNNPITYVSHNKDDGSWHFLSDDSIDNFIENIHILSIEDIVKIDKSVLKLYNIKKNYAAKRKNLNEDWIIYKLTNLE